MLTAREGRVETTRWYRFEPKLFDPMPCPAEATECLLELYKRAVQRHLISDVPLGLLLSGGIDSGLLLAIMGLYGKSWPTFTVGYGRSFKDDELESAAESARIFSATHAAVLLDQQTFERTLPRIVDILEEPVASSSDRGRTSFSGDTRGTWGWLMALIGGAFPNSCKIRWRRWPRGCRVWIC
jgi:asparagine synthase (glutamine-hydrolysing)